MNNKTSGRTGANYVQKSQFFAFFDHLNRKCPISIFFRVQIGNFFARENILEN